MADERDEICKAVTQVKRVLDAMSGLNTEAVRSAVVLLFANGCEKAGRPEFSEEEATAVVKAFHEASVDMSLLKMVFEGVLDVGLKDGELTYGATEHGKQLMTAR